MANHRANGRAQIRPLAPSGRGTHRDTAVVTASIAKVGVLGALATATIAVPLASATAGSSNSIAEALPAPVATANADEAAPATSQTVSTVVAAPAAVAIPGSTAAAVPAAAVADMTVTAAVKPATTAGSVDVSDVAPADGGYILPVNAPVTSPYGWRIHPTLGYRKMHDGIDYGAACGTPVKAAAAGKVIKAQDEGVSGNRVEVDHGNGVVTGYFHLQSFDVKVGDTVAQGQSVGKVGSTGRSTGCHLHFAKMDRTGTPSDPNTLFQ